METLVNNEEYRVPSEWLRMWRLCIPQRIKVFLWRMLRGVLPTRMRLQDKGCETNYENDWLVFIGCEKAKREWREAGLWDKINNNSVAANNLTECVFSLFCNCSEQVCSEIAMMLWCIWRRRNNKVWEAEQKSVRTTIQMARDFFCSWYVARRKQVPAEHQLPAHLVTRWQPPIEWYVKCNIDAALFSDQQCFGVGMCIRNAQGHFFKALTKWFDYYPTPLEAEALGL